MDMQNWESTLRTTASEIELLSQRIQQLISTEDPSAFERISRASDDAQLQAMLDSLRISAGGAHGQPARIAALRHWIGTAAIQIQNYYRSQTVVLTKMMWLKLIQTRLTGNRSTNQGTSSQEVVEMSIRRSNLRKSRDFLRIQLDRLKREKDELHRRYQTLDIQRSNYSAAQSMKIKLGSPRRDLRNNPLMQSLDRFFSRLTLPVRMRNKNLQHAVSLVHAVDVRSTDLMDQFRYVAEKSNRKDRDGSSTREAISTIKSGRAEINELDQMLTAAEKELTQPNPPSRPKIRLKKPDNNRQFRL
jgi:hypothetical protein